MNYNTSITIASLSIMAFLLVGCGGPLPNTKSREGKSPPGNLQKAVREVFDSRFVKSGGSYYAALVYMNPDISSMLAESQARFAKNDMKGAMGVYENPSVYMLRRIELIELKGLRTMTTQYELNEADRLNDVRWKGNISITAEAQRRKTIDLTQVLQAAMESPKSTVEIPWIDRKLTLVAVGGDTKDSTEKEKDSQDGVDPVNIWKTILSAIEGDTAELFAESEWSDWTSGEGTNFQYSEAELRGSEVTIETDESMDVLKGNDIVFVRTPTGSKGQLDFLGAFAGSGEATAFVTKPNLKELRKSGQL